MCPISPTQWSLTSKGWLVFQVDRCNVDLVKRWWVPSWSETAQEDKEISFWKCPSVERQCSFWWNGNPLQKKRSYSLPFVNRCNRRNSQKCRHHHPCYSNYHKGKVFERWRDGKSISDPPRWRDDPLTGMIPHQRQAQTHPRPAVSTRCYGARTVRPWNVLQKNKRTLKGLSTGRVFLNVWCCCVTLFTESVFDDVGGKVPCWTNVVGCAKARICAPAWGCLKN